MVRRHDSLRSQQQTVLQWIAEGCPDGVMTGSTYKTSSYALRDRGLVTVSKRGGVWSAAITEAGQQLLVPGSPAPAPQPSAKRSLVPHAPKAPKPARVAPSASFEVTVSRLLDELNVHGGALTVSDPSAEVRAAYRRAISAAIREHAVPAGQTIRHSGRDSGDLVIRLIDQSADEQPQPPVVPAAVSLDPDVPVIRQLLDEPARLEVSDAARPRAMLLIQALHSETDRRGYQLGARNGDEPGFRIQIEEDTFDFTLSEELDRVEQFDPEEVASKRYSWQRVSSRTVKAPSGRLVITMMPTYHRLSWSDRKRWRLDDRLSDILQLVESRAAEARERRARLAAEKERRRTEWEAAVPLARQRYAAEFNRNRLDAQLDAHDRAERIRRFCGQLDELAEQQVDGPTRQAIRKWAALARREAEAVDPLTNLDQLRVADPPGFSPAAVNRFMPHGWSISRPPD